MNDKIASHTQRRIRRLELLVYSLGFVVFLLLVWILSVSFQSRSIIKATGFQLVSDSDIVMGEFGFNGTSPILYLADEAGRKRLIATHDIEGTRVFLNDADGTTRVGIAQFSHGGGGIALHGEKGKGAAVLYYKQQGSLRFFDKKGDITRQITGNSKEN